jgi:hypothetical protein
MSVLIQSGSIVDADESQIINTPEIRNAGTYQNAGTVNQSKSNVASGVGLGIGSASVSKGVSASGIGAGIGSASVITAEFVREGQIVTIQETQTRSFDNIANAGTVQSAGTTVDTLAINTTSASGVGDGFGQATTNRFRRSFADGLGQGLGIATTDRFRDTIASGTGLGFGTSVDNRFRDNIAAGAGLGVGSATTDNFRDNIASGIGLGIGTARKPLPFDPILQISRLLQDTSASCFRYEKPSRIDTIWEYSHNDRINFRDAAFYVYTPTDASIDKFSIDGDNFNQTLTIEILVMTLDPQETSAYLRDLSQLISGLYNDNTVNSFLFHRFGNINAADLRNEHITQQSDHYIGSVTFEVQQFKSAKEQFTTKASASGSGSGSGSGQVLLDTPETGTLL